MCGNEFQWLDACANVTSNADLSELFTKGKLSQLGKKKFKKLYATLLSSPHYPSPPLQEPNEAELTLSPID